MGIKITCKDATYLSSLYQDGKLSFADKLRYFLHLLVCPPCRKFVKQIKTMSSLIKASFHSNEKKSSFQLSEQQKQRIEKVLNENMNDGNN